MKCFAGVKFCVAYLMPEISEVFPKKREDTTAGRHEQSATLEILVARNAQSIHSERR